MNKLVLSNEAISIAVRDLFLKLSVLSVKLILTNLFFKLFVKFLNRPFMDVLPEILQQIIFILPKKWSKSLTL